MLLHSFIQTRIDLFLYSLNETIPLGIYDEKIKVIDGAIYRRKSILKANEFSPSYKSLSRNYSYDLVSNFYISQHSLLEDIMLQIQFSVTYQCNHNQEVVKDYQEFSKKYLYFSVPLSQEFLDEEHFLNVSEKYQELFPDDIKFNGINIVFENRKDKIETYYVIKLGNNLTGIDKWLKSKTYDFKNDQLFLEQIKSHIDQDIDINDIKENLIDWIKYIQLLDY